MKTYHFFGRVLPESMPISVEAGGLRVSNGNNGLSLEINLSIVHSAIKVEVLSNRFESGDFSLMLRRALHVTNAAVDMVAFSTGAGLRVILDEFAPPDGPRTAIKPVQPNLARLCTAYDAKTGNDDSFDDVFKIVATTPHLFLALNDLIVGLYDPDAGAIVPARAVETIRRLFAPEGSKTDEQWRLMREALRLTKEYLLPITNISVGPRHGERTVALQGDISVVAERSWVVMNRCLEYFKRNNGPLPESEFPTL